MQNQNQNEAFIPLELVKAFVLGCCRDCQRRMTQQLITMQGRPLPTAIGPLYNLLLEVARIHGLQIDEVKGRSNMAHLVAARRDFSKRARAQGYSLPRIGMFLNRHHTTILHLVRT